MDIWAKIQELVKSGLSQEEATKKAFTEIVKENETNFHKEVNSLTEKNKYLQNQLDESSKSNKDIQKEKESSEKRLSIFKDGVLKKFGVSSVKIDDSKLDYSNADNYEKSILKQLEDNGVSIQVKPEKPIGTTEEKENKTQLYI